MSPIRNAGLANLVANDGGIIGIDARGIAVDERIGDGVHANQDRIRVDPAVHQIVAIHLERGRKFRCTSSSSAQRSSISMSNPSNWPFPR